MGRPDDDLTMCDFGQSLELGALGFVVDKTEPVYARAPSAAPAAQVPSELEVSEVVNRADLEEFERASGEGFESPTAGEPLQWHAEASLGHPDMRYYIGRVGGRAVSVSIGCVSDGIIGVYGVATAPDHRLRGYGTAMTHLALSAAPHLTAVLEPSPEGASMYRRVGFGEIGQTTHWRRTARV